MQVVEDGCDNTRVYRVVKDDDGVHFHVGFHRSEDKRLEFHLAYYRFPEWLPLSGMTAPVELLQHIWELALQAQVKWKLPRTVYKLKGGPFRKEKSVKVPKGAPGTVERFAEMAEAFTRFGVRLGR